MQMIEISVVTPTYNRLDRLQQVVKGFEAQTYPLENFEVIIVSDGSSDGTNEYLTSLKTSINLKFILQQNRGVASARNVGVDQATGEFVLFVDDDVVPAADLIFEHMRLHEDQDDVVVLGPMLTPPDFDMRAWVQWEQAMLMKQYDDMLAGRWQPTARQFYTGNTSLARSFLLQTGGFDPEIRRAEDVELAYRLAELGVVFLFNMEAVGYHYAERSFSSWMNIPYEYGRYDVIFAREKGQTWLLPVLMYEYQERNLLIRGMTRVCLDRHKLSQIVVASLKYVAAIGHKLKLSTLTRIAYSGIFNLRHYQGVSDELGGRKLFFKGISETDQKPMVPGEIQVEEIISI